MISPLDVGVALGNRFRILRRIGAGGMGVVYEAYDNQARCRVALKTLREVSGQAVYRLKQEFRSLADVHHPNLVRLGDLFFSESTWFFTMELIDGDNLLDHVRATDAVASDSAPTLVEPLSAGWDEARLRNVLRQLAEGIGALHTSGKVHRDIKPSNVMVTRRGRVVLLDFGLVAAVAPTDAHPSAGEAVGTALYMAPEQAAGQPPAPAADWYSLGVLLYELLAGAPPFRGASLFDLLAAKQRLPQPPPGPPDLARLCLDLLQPDPSARPSSSAIAARLGADAVRHTSVPPAPAKRFVGRRGEIAALRAALANVIHGLQAVLVRGVSGIGKTALVTHFVESVGGAAWSLRGRCYEREAVPYKAFDGAIDALSGELRRMDASEVGFLLTRDVALLARLFPSLLRVPAIAAARAPDADATNPEDLRRRAFQAFAKLLEALSEQKPVIVLVDDMHWADADSFRMLEALLQEARALPILFIACVRTDTHVEHLLDGTTRRRWVSILAGDVYVPRPADTPSIAQLFGHADVLDMELAPLPQEEMAELVSSVAEEAHLSREQARAIARESQGTPLFALELAHWYAAHDDAPPPSAVRLEDVIWTRACRLDAHARSMLELIAVGGAPLPRSVIVEASGLTPDHAERCLAALRAAQLVHTQSRESELIEPYHDRIREAVAARIGSDRQHAHHARLAAVIEASAHGMRNPRLLVHHLGGAGERRRAAFYARRAAEAALDALAFDQAAEYYRLACSLGGATPGELFEMRLAMARCLREAGRGSEAAEQFLRVARQADPATRTECRSEAAQQLLMSGNISAGLEILEEVLRELDEPRAPTPRAALRRLLWQRGVLRVRGLRFRERDAADVSAAELLEIDMHRTLGMVLGFIDHVLGAQFHTRGLLLALRAGEPVRIGRGLVIEALYAAARGGKGFDRCRVLLQRAAELATRVDDPYLDITLRGAEGFVRYFSGAFREAAEYFVDLEEHYLQRPFAGRRFALHNVRLFRLISLRHTGQLREVTRLTDLWLRDAAVRGDQYMETSLARAMNVRWLIDDRPDEAQKRLETARWAPPEGTFHVQDFYGLISECELGLYRGEGPRVAEACRERMLAYRASLLPRLVACRNVAQWLDARIELARDDPDRRRVERIARRLDGEGLGSARAWSLLVRGTSAHRSGDAMRALELLAAAQAHCEALGMAGLARVAQKRRGQIMGGEVGAALANEADSWLLAQGVVNPDRYADLYAPGFPRH